jgi:CheY-like chemotaxis protein
MKSKPRILIVDDHSEVRRMLRSGLVTLGIACEIVDLPSGEEALLEASQQAFDLLVADVRLAGMTGLELKEKIQHRNPDSKVILITGVTDPKIRQQVADAQAHAYFFKPIPMSAFLDTARRFLSQAAPDPPPTAEKGEQGDRMQTLTDHLANLRQELKAISASLMDADSQILASSGDLPDGVKDSAIAASLMESLKNSRRISSALGSSSPANLLCFEGSKFDLAFCHAGPDHLLLVAANKGVGSEYLGTLGFSLHRTVKQILPLLAGLKSSPKPEDEAGDLPEIPKDLPGRQDEIPPEDMQGFIEAQEKHPTDPEQADDFWEKALDGHTGEGPHQTDLISYDEADGLGLAPDESEN